VTQLQNNETIQNGASFLSLVTAVS